MPARPPLRRVSRALRRAGLVLLAALLPPASPAAEAVHSLYLSHDLRTATLVTAAPSPSAPDSFTVLARRDTLPVDVSYRYDGVRFDVFPRNPKTDPEFGAGSTEALDTVISVTWPEGASEPAGPVRFFKGEIDQPLFCLGVAPGLPAPDSESIRTFALPSANGLSGRRIRTAFRTVPGGVAESFEITIRNDTSASASVSVVEHLLRSIDWEIVSSSVSQKPDRGNNLIVMESTIPPGAAKTLSYTVRYQWPDSP